MGGPSPWVVSALGDGGDGLGSWPPTSCDSLGGKDWNTRDTKGEALLQTGVASVESRDVLHTQGTQGTPVGWPHGHQNGQTGSTHRTPRIQKDR